MARQPIPNPTPKKKAPASTYPSKAYAPVPIGYKGNWNVPKGTPWKKDSPFNPANRNKGPVSPVTRTTSVSASRAVSPTPSPRKIAGAKKAAATRVAASYKASDDKSFTMAKQGRAVTAARKSASAKQMASPTSRVTKKPAGYKPAAAPKVPTPQDRKGSMANIKRAAQTNRKNQRSAAAANLSRTSKSVSRGTKNKLKGM